MKMICEKAYYDPSCMACPHSEEHEHTNTCIGTKCMAAANAFAKRNKNCIECEFSKTCEQYSAKKQSSIDFKKRRAHAEKVGRGYVEPDERIVEIQQRLENPVVDLFKRGEDCGSYNALITFAKCKEVK